jgi:hypothetical protein
MGCTGVLRCSAATERRPRRDPAAAFHGSRAAKKSLNVQVIDITASAVARARLLNGSRVSAGTGLVCLILSLVFTLAGEWGTALLFAGIAGIFVVLAGLMKRESRAAAALCCVLFVAILILGLSGMSLLHWLLFAVPSFFALQGARGAFTLHAKRAVRVPGRNTPSKRPTKPHNPPTAIVLGLWAGAVVAWGTGLLLVFGRYFGDAMAYLTDAIAFGLMALGYASYRRAKRHLAAPALDIRRQDNRPPVLLLRSFGDDMIPVQEFRLSFFIQRSQTFEEILTQHLWDYGPVIAIGRPREAIPPLGAAREYVRNEDWQSRLNELSASAGMLVLVLGRTEGVLWEIRRVISAGLLSKTVFVLPPVKEEELRRLLARSGHPETSAICPLLGVVSTGRRDTLS